MTIGLIGNTSPQKLFRLVAGSSLAVVAGDIICVQMVCPTWVTNPTAVKVSWVVRVEY